MPTPSLAFSFNKHDLKEVAIAFGALLLAAVLSFIICMIGQFNFGQYGPLIAAVLMPLLHMFMKYIKDNSAGLPDAALIQALPGKTDV